MPPRARTHPAGAAAPAGNALGSHAAVDAGHPSEVEPPTQDQLATAADLTDATRVAEPGALFDAPEPDPYAIPPARTLREAPARMLRVRQVVQMVRDDMSAAALDVEFPVDRRLADAVVRLANCVEALAEINT